MLQLIAVGYIGRDAVVKEHNGKKVINFSVAHTEKFKKQDGIVVEKTTWVDCSVWDKENLAPYLKQGTQVLIQGTPESYAYTTKDGGELRSSLKCSVLNIQLLSGAKTSTQNAKSTQVKEVKKDAPVPADAIDDLPF
jgi:single-strand DNA-binding protein